MAEVLITLAVIGIVTALTMPSLINKYRAVEMKTRFDKAYSVISQAFELMKIDNGGYIDGSSYSSNTFAPVFQQYFRTVKAHVGDANYDADLPTYKNFAENADFYKNLLDDGTIYLSDGSIIYLENPIVPSNLPNHVYIFVDINGLKGPNVVGKDLFGFRVTEDSRLVPLGIDNGGRVLENIDEIDDLCNESSSSVYNGMYCTSKVLNDKDYFKKIFN